MAIHFFFDGEQAENFTSKGNKEKLGKAVKEIMGAQIVNTAIEDLGNVRKNFKKRWKIQ